MTRDDYYVYVIYRPDGSPCYVGKGRGKRLQQHYWRSSNQQLECLLAANNRSLESQKVAENISHTDALAIEMSLIRDIGRTCDGGPLFNKAIGGHGSFGHIASDETKRKISVAAKGRKMSQQIRENQRGKVFSPETREKMRAAKLGRRLSDSHRAAIGAAHRGTRRDPEWGKKISTSKMGHRQSEATKAKISATKLAGKRQ